MPQCASGPLSTSFPKRWHSRRPPRLTKWRPQNGREEAGSDSRLISRPVFPYWRHCLSSVTGDQVSKKPRKPLLKLMKRVGVAVRRMGAQSVLTSDIIAGIFGLHKTDLESLD